MNIFKRYKQWKEKKFIDKIDKLYFKRDKDENIYLKGILHVDGCIYANRVTATAPIDK